LKLGGLPYLRHLPLDDAVIFYYLRNVIDVILYLSYLSNAILVLPARRFDIPGKKIFEIGERYYFEDLGIRHALVGFRAVDIDKVMENVIFTHLKVAGYDVTVGQIGKKEVDFVCEKAGERIYIQAAYMISDDKVRHREFGNLLAITDNFPKKVISMDEVVGSSILSLGTMKIKPLQLFGCEGFFVLADLYNSCTTFFSLA